MARTAPRPRNACPEPRPRNDGWTVRRQLLFLKMLERTRSVSASARAVGMSREGAHRFRKRAPDGLFAAAWDLAMLPAAYRPCRAEIDEGHRRAIAAACSPEGAGPRRNRAARSTS